MNRSVLVTGGNRGIGLAIAQAFDEQGDRVAISHRDDNPLDGLRGVHCDVRNADEVDRAVVEVEEQHGPVEILVANAGITDDVPLLGMSDAQFTSVVDTNLFGAFRVARACAKGMLLARWGRVIFLSSALGFLGSPGQANYAAAKSGLVGLARCLVWEFGDRGITVNAVAPGIIDTDMTRPLSERRMADLMRMTPLGRPGTVEEVVAAVKFLASDEASYVTGAVLPVSGGIGMGQ